MYDCTLNMNDYAAGLTTQLSYKQCFIFVLKRRIQHLHVCMCTGVCR